MSGFRFSLSALAGALALCLSNVAPAVAAPAADPCTELVARLPNVRKLLCEAAQLQPTEGRSVQGRTLYMRDVVAQDPKIRVLVVGAMHGDELSSASVALHWIQRGGGSFARDQPLPRALGAFSSPVQTWTA